MCKNSEFKLIPIPDFILKHTNFERDHPEFGIDRNGRKCFKIDKCLVPLVKKLWNARFKTLGCCCGHGSYGIISIDIGGREWALVEVEHKHCGLGWVTSQSEFHKWRIQ